MKSIKKILAITLSLIMALGVLSVSVFAEDEITDEIISLVDITVAAPVAGEYAIGDYEFEGVDYSLTFRQWMNYDSGEILYSSDEDVIPADKAYEAGEAYVICLVAKAEEGFVFDAKENLIVSVNGYEAEVVDLSEDGKELSFTCIFECEAEEDIGGGDDGNAGGGFSFGQLLDLIKSVFLTFIRFLGSLIGIS